MRVTAGATSVSLNVYFVDDDGGTAPGEPTTGLLFSDIETGGSASYARQGAARVDVTLKTLASASAAYDEGGFILIDDTNMPGLYRVDIPDAAFAAGVDFVTIHMVAAGANNSIIRPLLVGIDPVPALIAALNDITAASVWALDATSEQTQGTFGQAIGDPGATAKSLWEATVSDAAGVSVSADVIAVKAETVLIVEDTGTTLPARFDGVEGATFATGTDSLEAIRNRGDAAWTTGAGGTPPQLLQSTTIATLATQVSFTLTAGSADDNAYINAIAVVTDQATAEQKAVGSISAYTGATKTVTLNADPAIFTMAAGDTIEIIANSLQLAEILDDTGTSGVVLTAAERNSTADAMLNRDMSAVSDTTARSPLNAFRFLRNKWSIAGTTLTVTKEDDSTSAWTSTVTADAAADPITGNDPA